MRRFARLAFVIFSIISTLSAAPALFAQGLLPNAVQTFTGANGAPVSSGFVYTYIPATTTPKLSYADQGLTVPNPNPLQLDTNGQGILWGPTGGIYREVVTDSLGNVIWDRLTQVSPPMLPVPLPLSAGGSGADLSATGGLHQVVTQPSPGAPFQVRQLAVNDLSDGTSGTGQVVMTSGATIAGPTISNATLTASFFGAGTINAPILTGIPNNPFNATLCWNTSSSIVSYTTGDLCGGVSSTGTGALMRQTSPAITTPSISGLWQSTFGSFVLGAPSAGVGLQGTNNYLAIFDTTFSVYEPLVALNLNVSTLPATVGSSTLCLGTNQYITGFIGITVCTSDERRKNPVGDITDGIVAVNAFKPKRFTLKEGDIMPGHEHGGFYAQDVLAVAPDCVTQNPADKFYTIETNCIAAYIARAVQELDARLVAHGM